MLGAMHYSPAPELPDRRPPSRVASIVRGIASVALASGTNRSPADFAKANWSGDREALAIATRGAVVPSSTSTVTAFSQTVIADLIALLGPMSASGQLFARFTQLVFDRNGSIWAPGILTSGTGVAFLLQGGVIPIKQFDLSAGVTLSPMKLALGVSMTRELVEGSNVQTLLETKLREDLNRGIDNLLFDATASSATRPQGLRNGVSPLTATVGGGDTAMSGDLVQLGAAVAGVGGLDIVYICSAREALKIATRLPLFKYPVLASAGVSDGTVIAIAPKAIAVVGGGDPMTIDSSMHGTIVLDDTSPAALGTVGTPNTVGAPARSLFQTDVLAFRLVMPLTWAPRVSPGAVAVVSSITW
jgi:hypothetical protein